MSAPRQGTDRGSTELLLATPLLLILVLLVIQTALAAHASQIAQTIAEQGLATARTVDGTETSGHRAAQQAADQLGGDLLHDATITVERSNTTARVQVQADVSSLIPGVHWPIEDVQSGPVERLTPPPGGEGP